MPTAVHVDVVEKTAAADPVATGSVVRAVLFVAAAVSAEVGRVHEAVLATVHSVSVMGFFMTGKVL